MLGPSFRWLVLAAVLAVFAALFGCRNGKSYLEPDMVLIPAGSFRMGSEVGEDNEMPVHMVSLSAFEIGRFEVTQAEWRNIMGNNPSYFSDCDQCPVEQVSWDTVQEFLQKLNARIPGKNFRLPTEAEWECAAREGGRDICFGNGKDTADPQEINFNCLYAFKNPASVAGSLRGRTVPVGSLNSPNAYGLHDMSGNVKEWCSDWYAKEYYGQFRSSGVHNPKGPITGISRVTRGGDFNAVPNWCRSTYRDNNFPNQNQRSCITGFRLARDADKN